MSSEVISRLISELKPHPRNYNNHGDRQVDDLALSLKRFGQRKPIVTWRDMIVAGHGLTMAAQMAGWTSILTMPIPDDWDEATVLAYLAADNELARQADPDLAQLAAITKELEGIDEELAKLAAGGDDALKALMATIEDEKPNGDAEPQIDKAEELRQKWNVQSGQMWQLGEHRIICGDCTDRAVVERVMAGEKINVCVTSPPYASQRKYDESSGFVPIHPDKYAEWWKPVQDAIKQHLAIDGSFFLNIKEHCEDGQRSLYVKDLTISHVRDWSWRFVDEFCWVRSGVPGKWPNRFKNGFEPIFHFCINENIKFRGEAVGHESDDLLRYSPDNPKTHSGFLSSGGGGNGRIHGIALPNNVLSISTARSDKDRGHTAEFPVDLPSFFIKAFSDKFDAIYEPFSGSGTTIIACENLSRKCRAVEISPAYVAVAIQRWVDATGKEPILL